LVPDVAALDRAPFIEATVTATCGEARPVAVLDRAALHRGVQYVNGMPWNWLVAAPDGRPFIEARTAWSSTTAI
jgi:hypothetical protein